MRKIWLLLIIAIAPTLAWAQGVFVPVQTAFKTVNGLTSPIANATITVCAGNTGGIPCSPALASTIFKDAALTQPLSNPFTADANGNYFFAIAASNSSYTVTVTASGFAGQSYQVSPPGPGSATPNLGNILFVDGTIYPRTCAGLNSAIQSAASTPGTIINVGGGGDISCNTTVVIDKPIILQMAGRSSRLVPAAGFAGPVISFLKDGNCTLNLFGQCVGAQLKNVWIEDTGFRSQNTNGISVTKWDTLVFNDVEIRGLKGYGLQIGSGANTADSVVRESRFDIRMWWCGDVSQSLPCVNVINSQADGDVDNDIWFMGKIIYPMWEAFRFNTTATVGLPAKGPGGIHLNHFQVEGREVVSDTNLQNTVPPIAPLFHIVVGQDFFITDSIFVACAQGQACIQADGNSANIVSQLNLDGDIIGAFTAVATTVNTSSTGNTVTATSGTPFTADGTWNGQTVTINSVSYVIGSVTSSTTMTLTTSPGNQSGVAFNIAGGGYGVATTWINSLIARNNEYFANPLGNWHITPANGGFYADLPPVADTTNTAGTIQSQPGAAQMCTNLQNNNTGGQGWQTCSLNTGNFSILPLTNSSASILFGNVSATQVTAPNLVFTPTSSNPTSPIPGQAWINQSALSGAFPHIIYWDGDSNDAAITNLDTPCDMGNGCTGTTASGVPTGATVTANSPSMNNPNVGNAAGLSLGLSLPTGDFLDLQSGSGKVVTGSLTSGSFMAGENAVQSTSGATATVFNSPTGSTILVLQAITGSPDSSHTWVGQTSGAVYTPTAAPATAYIRALPTALHDLFGYGSDNRYQMSNNGAAFSDVALQSDLPPNAFGQTTVLGGVGAELNTFTSTTQTAGLSSQQLVATTPPATTWYEIKFYVVQIGLGTSCTGNTIVAANVVYTDPVASGSASVRADNFQVITNGAANTPISCGAAGGAACGSFLFQAKASTSIAITATFTGGAGCATTPTYQISSLLEKK